MIASTEQTNVHSALLDCMKPSGILDHMVS